MRQQLAVAARNGGRGWKRAREVERDAGERAFLRAYGLDPSLGRDIGQGLSPASTALMPEERSVVPQQPIGGLMCAARPLLFLSTKSEDNRLSPMAGATYPWGFGEK